MKESQNLVFEIRMIFSQPQEKAAYDVFLDDFIEFIESRRLTIGGIGGQLPLLKADGIVSSWEKSLPSEEDRLAVLDWLKQRREVVSAEAGALMADR